MRRMTHFSSGIYLLLGGGPLPVRGNDVHNI